MASIVTMNERIKPLIIQKYVKLSQKRNIISFAAGLPDLSVLPFKHIQQSYSRLMVKSDAAFQYQAPIIELKEKIQSIMRKQSVSCTPQQILITNGAQQAVYLTAQLFFEQNAPLMIEEFIYPGFLQVASMFDLHYLPIPSDHKQGLDLNYLEILLKTRHPLPYLYVICNGHNPQSTTLNAVARKHLAYLAEKYHFVLIEDDPYGHLNFTDEHCLPLRAYTKQAIYIGSFSKTIAPALRMGWIVANQTIIEKLTQLKDMNDLCLSNPSHLVVNDVLKNRSLSDITLPQKILYKKKLDCMLSVLKKHMTIPFHYTEPKHGMFIWLEFPEHDIETCQDKLFELSKVLCIPASAFCVAKILSKQAIRLNFSYPSLDTIRLGIKKWSIALSQLAHKKTICNPS